MFQMMFQEMQKMLNPLHESSTDSSNNVQPKDVHIDFGLGKAQPIYNNFSDGIIVW